MNFSLRLCPICGSTKAKYKIESNFDYTKLNDFSFSSRKMPEYMHFRLSCCGNCDLLYVSDIPQLDWIKTNYDSAGFDTTIESYCASLTYCVWLEEILTKIPSPLSALDIGAGDGQFLIQLKKRGFNKLYGIEPSRAPIEKAAPEIKPNIHCGFFDGKELEKESVSLVTCFQALEHVDQPRKVIQDVFALLKPGGAIYLAVHNYRALMSKLLRTKSPIYDVEHLQLFSPESLRYLLRECGFTNIKMASLKNRYPLKYWLKLSPINLDFKKIAMKFIQRLHVANIVLPFWPGNTIAVGYKIL